MQKVKAKQSNIMHICNTKNKSNELKSDNRREVTSLNISPMIPCETAHISDSLVISQYPMLCVSCELFASIPKSVPCGKLIKR